jgi:hypothetical protein
LPAATFLQLLEAMDPVAGVAGPPPRETSQIHRRPLAGGALV